MLPEAKRPWTVAVSHSSNTGAWVVQLDHEASHGLVFDMGESGADADATIVSIRETLGRQAGELRRISAAPLLVNPDDVMEIRSLAHIFNWTQLEVRSVVALIRRWTLTDDEAEWLSSHIGRDAPTPTPSWDF